jgi:ATP-binding cassette subfamily B protein
MSGLVVLMRLVRFSPRYFAACLLFAISLLTILPIPLGFATQALFDALSGEKTAGLNAWSAIALMVGVQVAMVFVSPLLGHPWNAVRLKSEVLLQRNLFAAILRGYGHYGLPRSVGETIGRFRDDPPSIADGLDALCDLIARTLFAIAAAVIMWQINALLTAALFVPLLLCAFVSKTLEHKIADYRSAARDASARVSGLLADLIAAHLAVQVAGAVPRVVDRLTTLGHARRAVAVRDSVFEQVLDSLNLHIVHVGTGLVLLLGAQAIAAGTFTIGEFALFVVYLGELTWYPSEIGRIIGDLKRIEVSFERMRMVMPGASAEALVQTSLRSVPSPEATVETSSLGTSIHVPHRLERLDVRGLSFVYADGVQGICDVSFTLHHGSFTVITGRIGAGKSTLLQVLLGLLPLTRGEIRWNRQLIDDPEVFFVPPHTAYLPQVPRLFSDSLRDNVLLGRRADGESLKRAVHAAVLEPDLEALEHGLDTLVGPRGVKLSGGQIQRAAAARMFVREPQLLVIDDLSSALDAETEAELWRRLFAHGRDVTCLVVSHRPAALRRADQVLVLDGGRLR